MNHATITPTDNGPYLVQGEVTLLDAEGNAYESTDTIALCRCGLSATKPFCDGSHEKTHFKAINRAPTTPAPIGLSPSPAPQTAGKNEKHSWISSRPDTRARGPRSVACASVRE